MNKTETKERRKAKRIHFRQNILVNDAVLFKSIDISEGGLYVYTGRSFQMNSIMNVIVSLEGKNITFKAKVQHCQPGIGMGLKFIDLDDEKKAIIRKLIETAIKNSVQHLDEKKRILLVEDNDTTRQIYKSRLFMEGFSVVEAKNGMDALKFINKEPADLIILDLYMEEIDGFKVISILRASPQWQKLPVIAISSRGTKDVIEKVINTGANIFLSKMVTTPSKLAETAKAVLQQKG